MSLSRLLTIFIVASTLFISLNHARAGTKSRGHKSGHSKTFAPAANDPLAIPDMTLVSANISADGVEAVPAEASATTNGGPISTKPSYRTLEMK